MPVFDSGGLLTSRKFEILNIRIFANKCSGIYLGCSLKKYKNGCLESVGQAAIFSDNLGAILRN